MFGNNPIRPPENGDGAFLYVKEIFYTIQGEGPFSGFPSVFVRLGGCNLACSFCDTEFENFSLMSTESIINEVLSYTSLNFVKPIKLVVITGGEPLRQPIEKLCSKLIENNLLVQIETNGTLYRELPKEVKIICSPKIKSDIRSDLLERITAFKFIISKNNPLYSNVNLNQIKNNNIPVYIQPMDEYCEIKNQQNIDYCIELSLKYGYNICLQIHKILKLR